MILHWLHIDALLIHCWIAQGYSGSRHQTILPRTTETGNDQDTIKISQSLPCGIDYGDGQRHPGLPEASLNHSGQSLPSPSYVHVQKILEPTTTSPPHVNLKNLATSAHDSSPLSACSHDLPIPSPIHRHHCRCAAFCGFQPSHTQPGSSVLPISFSHCFWGPLSVTT